MLEKVLKALKGQSSLLMLQDVSGNFLGSKALKRTYLYRQRIEQASQINRPYPDMSAEGFSGHQRGSEVKVLS